MRVLLSTYGSRGDVEPLVALAVQLRALGADVRMCAPPDEEFVELLARYAVPMVPFAKPWRSWERPPAPAERRQRVTDFIAAQYDTLAEATDGCDVVVATAMSQFVAPSVAEQRGVPYHYALFCPDVLEGLDGQDFDTLFGAAIEEHRVALGLPSVAGVGELMFTARPLLAADPTLGPWRASAGFDPVRTGAWLLADERPLGDDVLGFLESGEPPVYVGFGSMRTVGADGARVAVEAIRAQGRRVVIGRGWAGLDVVDERDDCIVVGDVNHQQLFPRLAAVIHHGGAGTTTTAARAGAPQLVLPQGGDQVYWAGRVADLGIGAAHERVEPTAESLSTALAAVLSAETSARAATVAARVAVDGAAVAARMLLGSGPGRITR
jgi:vancomycin aglycone glucosyltransferase